VVWQADERRRQAISATTAFLMSSMLSDVVARGTATRARRAGFTLPAGGKTGTTDDYSDAWFIGYTPHLLTGVWFGLDTPAPIMRDGFGGTVAVPAWARFMRAATTGAKPDWYPMPSDVEKVAICRISSARAGPGCREVHAIALTSYPGAESTLTVLPPDVMSPAEPNVYEDLFPAGAIPPETCPLHAAPAHPSMTPLVDAALSSPNAETPNAEPRSTAHRLASAERHPSERR
jgi:penicillin-binding protein 1A